MMAVFVCIISLLLIISSVSAKVLFQCRFEQKMCNMRVDPGAFPWVWSNQDTPTPNTGPKKAQDGKGFIFFEASNPKATGGEGRITTRRLSSVGDICIEFWYHMYGKHVGSLELFAQRGIDYKGTHFTIWKVSSVSEDKWKLQQSDFTLEYHNQGIGWRAVSKGYESDIALDSIKIFTGKCNPEPTTALPVPGQLSVSFPYFCDFESNNDCGMVNKKDDQYDWKVISGPTPTNGTGPDAADGGRYYIYAPAAGHKRGDLALLQVPNLLYTGVVCLSFSFMMYGEGLGQLYVYTQRQNKERVHEFAVEGSKGKKWFYKELTLDIRRTEVIGFEAVRGSNSRSDIALDNVRVELDNCEDVIEPTTLPPSTGRALPYECNFEYDFCDMTPMDQGTLDWVRHTGPTETVGTGPLAAYEKDYYIYMEADSAKKQHEKAFLATPELRYDGDICISFADCMYGKDVGSLVLYTQHEDEDDLNQLIARSGDRGQEWRWEMLDATIQRNDKIVIMARRGASVFADIAIDDFSVRPGKCEGHIGGVDSAKGLAGQRQRLLSDYLTIPPTTTPPPTTAMRITPQPWTDVPEPWTTPKWVPTTTTTRRPTPQPYLEPTTPKPTPAPTARPEWTVHLPWSCSFEYDLCGMTQMSNDDFDWTRHRGPTDTMSTGPNQAYDGEWYMYIESSAPRVQKDRAYLASPLIVNYEGPVCLKFGYNMRGDKGIGWLVVYVKSVGERRPIFSVTGNRYSEWIQVKLNATIERNDKIVFFAQRGKTPFGDIAVDKVELSPGFCPTKYYPPIAGIVTPSPKPYPSPYPTPYPTPYPKPISTTPKWPKPWPQPSTTPAPPWQNVNPWPNSILNPGPTPSPWVAPWPAPSPWPIPTPGPIPAPVATPAPRPTPAPWPTPGSWVTPAPRPTPAPWPIPAPWPSSNEATQGLTPSTNDLRDSFSCNIEYSSQYDPSCELCQVQDDDLDWIRTSEKTPSGKIQDRIINDVKYPVTGPVGADGGEYYLYVEATNTQKGDKARLEFNDKRFRRKRSLSNNGMSCLRFSFNMNGFHTGALRVYTVRSGQWDRKYIWEISGDQGIQWQHASVDVDTSVNNKLGFEAELTGFFSSDIALDNIRLDRGACQGIVWQCDFEVDGGAATWCGLEQNPANNFRWKLVEGATPSPDTGPSEASRGKYYIFAEASQPVNQGDRSSIRLPPIGQYGDMCLRFDYHMWGFHMGWLEVTYTRGQQVFRLWSAHGDQGDDWREAVVRLENVLASDQIIFTAIVGDGFSSDIGLDNIRVTWYC